jgi:hypothetical protein
LILYEPGEELAEPFADRILSHHPDWVIWLNPDPAQRQMLDQLQDTGLHVVAIGDRPETTLPGQQYFLSWERALRKGLESWRRDGIQRVVIPGSRAWRGSTSLTHVVDQVLGQSDLTYSYHEMKADNCVTIIDAIGRLPLDAHTGILFDDDMSFGYQFRNAPVQLLDLLRRHRAIVGRPIDLPSDYLKDVRVDAIQPDWRKMAKRIAADVSSEAIHTHTDMVTFHAAWYPRIAADALLQIGDR